jgi:uncharacterized integral membrane protein
MPKIIAVVCVLIIQATIGVLYVENYFDAPAWLVVIGQITTGWLIYTGIERMASR